MSDSKIQSVKLTSNIIESIGKHNGATVSDVTDELGIPKSTAHVHIQTLVDIGYINRRDGEYYLGLTLLEKGGRVVNQFRVSKSSKPEINRLAYNVDDLSVLGVEYRGTSSILYKAEGTESVDSSYESLMTPIGTRRPLHWSAIGKIMLSNKKDTELEEYIETHGLAPSTEHTLTDREEFFNEIKNTRNNGYSLEDGEYILNVRAVAVPLQTDGDNNAAISVAGPKHRLSDSRIKNDILESLRETKDRIELKLGLP